jgi:serine/threonine protein kinase
MDVLGNSGVGGDNSRLFNVLGTRFECPARYSLIKPIGQGAYGIVCSAKDTITGEPVAIKKIAGIIENVTDCKRTLREMKLLRHFRHENVIAIKDVYVPAADGPQFHDVYTVTELMDTDLHQIIASGQGLTDEHCQYFTYQILKALKHIHSANVLHRDLKPSNILVNGNCDLKICDFGLARVANPDEESHNLTAYVATRWYRAPEIILTGRDYTNAVDMWSVGCILAEILLRRPLFPGRDHLHQLNLVTDVIGTPSPSDLENANNDRARKYIETFIRHKDPMPLSSIFPNAPPALLDLLSQMLVFDPSRRITVEDALQHPYLSSLHDPEDEPGSPQVFNFDFDQEDTQVDRDTLRRLIWEEMLMYHHELR